MDKFNENEIAPFVYVKNVDILKDILHSRLPESANVYSMAAMSANYASPEEMAFFYLEVDPCHNNCWILATDYREDQGLRYNISAPTNAVATEMVKNAFCSTKLINWNKRFLFSAVQRNISRFLWDIIVCEKNNNLTVIPTSLYYMDPSEAVQIQLDNVLEKYSTSDVQLKGINPEVGTPFFYSTWKHKRPNSEIAMRKILERNKSAGLFFEGKLVSGTLVNGSGILTMLYTLPEFRNRGFATLVMKYLLNDLAASGLFPCSVVELHNTDSINFHEKVGMKFSHFADYMRNIPDAV